MAAGITSSLPPWTRFGTGVNVLLGSQTQWALGKASINAGLRGCLVVWHVVVGLSRFLHGRNRSRGRSNGVALKATSRGRDGQSGRSGGSQQPCGRLRSQRRHIVAGLRIGVPVVVAIDAVDGTALQHGSRRAARKWGHVIGCGGKRCFSGTTSAFRHGRSSQTRTNLKTHQVRTHCTSRRVDTSKSRTFESTSDQPVTMSFITRRGLSTLIPPKVRSPSAFEMDEIFPEAC